jgi:ketosteroid isomerase-like protein
MKNLIILLALITFSCVQPTKQPVNMEAAKKEVSAMMDQFHATMFNKDASAQMSLLTEDGTFCGTDPGEVWDKKTLSDYMTKAFSDTAMVIMPYTIDKREIKIDDDGQCAFILDQFTFDAISQKIPVRFTAHAVKQDDKWMIDFSSMALIPKNEDMMKLNEALK